MRARGRGFAGSECWLWCWGWLWGWVWWGCCLPPARCGSAAPASGRGGGLGGMDSGCYLCQCDLRRWEREVQERPATDLATEGVSSDCIQVPFKSLVKHLCYTKEPRCASIALRAPVRACRIGTNGHDGRSASPLYPAALANCDKCPHTYLKHAYYHQLAPANTKSTPISVPLAAA